MKAVPCDEWIIALPPDDPRHIRLLRDIPAQDLLSAVERDAEVQLSNKRNIPRFENSERRAPYKRFTSVIRLSEETFDFLINGRMGYRAQYYLGLEQGRGFNRDVINVLIPIMKAAWANSKMEEWSLAQRSLMGENAKMWPALDDVAFRSQPRLEPPMWVANCNETRTLRRGLHLASPNPPTIELKGAWVSAEHEEYWIPPSKRCRDELLRCFGFT